MNSSLEGTVGIEIIVAGEFPGVVVPPVSAAALDVAELAGVPARVCDDDACAVLLLLVVVIAT